MATNGSVLIFFGHSSVVTMAMGIAVSSILPLKKGFHSLEVKGMLAYLFPLPVSGAKPNYLTGGKASKHLFCVPEA
jgi:hypothetical protein